MVRFESQREMHVHVPQSRKEELAAIINHVGASRNRAALFERPIRPFLMITAIPDCGVTSIPLITVAFVITVVAS